MLQLHDRYNVVVCIIECSTENGRSKNNCYSDIKVITYSFCALIIHNNKNNNNLLVDLIYK